MTLITLDASQSHDVTPKTLKASKATKSKMQALDTKKLKKKKSKAPAWFNRLVGKPLNEDEINDALNVLSKKLIARNVAIQTSQLLCKELAVHLKGQILPRIGYAQSIIEEIAVNMFIQPIQKYRPITAVKQDSTQPVVLLLCGVNGVGKTTTLAKLVYYLQRYNMRVSVAACDSFRSGAIEQLMTHSKALDFKLHVGAYGDNPIKIAKRAVFQSNQDNDDVLIIDTAGRMVGNDSLMRALGQLVSEVKPDRVYLVSEALTGTDGIMQVKGFNDYILRASTSEYKSHGIDAIILSKLDTVDGKTGAIVNLTYETGIPIEFVGTGQRYTDLSRFDFAQAVKKLLK